MTEKPGKLPKVNDWDNIVRVINKSPKNFLHNSSKQWLFWKHDL